MLLRVKHENMKSWSRQQILAVDTKHSSSSSLQTVPGYENFLKFFSIYGLETFLSICLQSRARVCFADKWHMTHLEDTTSWCSLCLDAGSWTLWTPGPWCRSETWWGDSRAARRHTPPAPAPAGPAWLRWWFSHFSVSAAPVWCLTWSTRADSLTERSRCTYNCENWTGTVLWWCNDCCNRKNNFNFDIFISTKHHETSPADTERTFLIFMSLYV